MRALVPQIKEADLLDFMRSLDVPLNRGETLHDKLNDLKAQMYIADKEEKDEEDQKQVGAVFVWCLRLCVDDCGVLSLRIGNAAAGSLLLPAESRMLSLASVIG